MYVYWRMPNTSETNTKLPFHAHLNRSQIYIPCHRIVRTRSTAVEDESISVCTKKRARRPYKFFGCLKGRIAFLILYVHIYIHTLVCVCIRIFHPHRKTLRLTAKQLACKYVCIITGAYRVGVR